MPGPWARTQAWAGGVLQLPEVAGAIGHQSKP